MMHNKSYVSSVVRNSGVVLAHLVGNWGCVPLKAWFSHIFCGFLSGKVLEEWVELEILLQSCLENAILRDDTDPTPNPANKHDA